MKYLLIQYYLFFNSLFHSFWLRFKIKNTPLFCFFIGYGRSGHSLIGSLLDAHPKIVISHEQHILSYLKIGFSQYQLYWLMIRNSKNFKKKGRRWGKYSYHIPGSWQGRFKDIKVIGDKKGGATT